MKICPGALARLKLPETIIAVTGSNGKTSTVELLVRALESGGKNVGWNHEGANQIEGVATLLMRLANFRGLVKCDAIVFECDERFARRTFEAVRPSVTVVTNLCRDQLTRNGHPEYIQDCLRHAIRAAGERAELVLNADDPYVTALSKPQNSGPDPGMHDCFWFGVSHGALDPLEREIFSSGFSSCPYDDGAFCPECKARMAYDYRIAGHFGGYSCKGCGHRRPPPDVEIQGLDLRSGEVSIVIGPESVGSAPGRRTGNSKSKPVPSGSPGGCISTRLAFPSLTGAYNLAAAIAAAELAGVTAAESARALNGYELKGGRTMYLYAGENKCLLLVSKHENSLSYNQSLATAVSRGKPCTVIVLVDSISRKYYTSETSWLWDVDFNILACECVKNVALAGRYSSELMARVAMTTVDPGKCSRVDSLGALKEYAGSCGTDDIYILTCFADKAKLLKAFKQVRPDKYRRGHPEKENRHAK